MTDPGPWPGMTTYTERRQAAARLRASAAIVAVRRDHDDPLAAWLDDLAARISPPLPEHDEHDQEDTP